MNYKVVFSVQGLINEYIEPAVVIRDGRLQTVPSLSELETLTFPAPFGELEAFQTSGGTSTLPETLLGRVPHLDYKTIRYRGHCAQVRLLHELGLTDSRPVEFKEGRISPRRMLAHVLGQALDLPGEDVVLVLCTAEGWQGDRARAAQRAHHRPLRHRPGHLGHDAHDRLSGGDHRGHAGRRAPSAERGALRQELVVPGDLMIAELRRRGVEVEVLEGRPGEPA